MVLSMDRWKAKLVVVSGVCGGLGGAIAEQLLDEGLQVVGVDTRYDIFEELSTKYQDKKGKFYTFTVDITKEEEVGEFFQTITDEIGPVHILINSAGIVQQTNLIDGDTEKWKKVLDVNVLGTCIMTREAINIMKNNKIDGHIIHISSIFGHSVPNLPDVNLYPASKYAIRAITETLRLEIIRLGLKIKVTCISPGKLTSVMTENNGFVFKKEIIEMIKNMPKLDPSDVADAILYALSSPPSVGVHEIVIKPIGEIHF